MVTRPRLGNSVEPGEVVAYARDGLSTHPGWEGRGLLLNAPRPNLLRFMPALTVTWEEIDLMLDGLRLAIEAVRAPTATSRRQPGPPSADSSGPARSGYRRS